MNYKNNIVLVIMLVILGLSACGTKASNIISEDNKSKEISTSTDTNGDKTKDFGSMSFDEKVELKYAKQFNIEKCNSYKLITVHGEDRYLVVPKDEEIPENVPKDVVVLKQPLDNTYLVSSSAMDLINAVDGIDNIKLTGTKEGDWYLPYVKERISDGRIKYAGKYSAPDYELILDSKCKLTIENTMIYHNPEVKEKLEQIGIPVLVEYSSYEEHPLGRLEWLKLYGVLYDKEEAAYELFDKQISEIEPIMEMENTGLKVAFFYINGNGAVNVRKPNDYVAKMINLSGGEYIFNNLEGEDENALSTINMQMEDFYATAKNADVLIYNSTIDGEIETIDELIEKSNLFADFEAVKNNRVYCTRKNFFQETTEIGNFMKDLNFILTNESEEGLQYIYKLR